tara:strand:+ start:198 stop:917 length:720 start_codon:yes stop_codon:yes gene_type:complete
MTTVSTVAVRAKFNLFNSLPDDLIRNVCEFDTTYRYVFSKSDFKCEITKAYWCQHSLQEEISKVIYSRLLDIQYDGNGFANRFLEMNMNTEEDSIFYFTRQTEGMTEDEIDTLPTTPNRICRDLQSETSIYFSVFENVLRWVVIPKSFVDKAEVYFNRREAECGSIHLYDGMCSLYNESSETDLYRLLSLGRIKPVVESVNIGFYHYDAISVSALDRMPNDNFVNELRYTSGLKFVLWH